MLEGIFQLLLLSAFNKCSLLLTSDIFEKYLLMPQFGRAGGGTSVSSNAAYGSSSVLLCQDADQYTYADILKNGVSLVLNGFVSQTLAMSLPLLMLVPSWK